MLRIDCRGPQGSGDTTSEASVIIQRGESGGQHGDSGPGQEESDTWYRLKLEPKCFEDGSHVGMYTGDKEQLGSTQGVWPEQLEGAVVSR